MRRSSNGFFMNKSIQSQLKIANCLEDYTKGSESSPSSIDAISVPVNRLVLSLSYPTQRQQFSTSQRPLFLSLFTTTITKERQSIFFSFFFWHACFFSTSSPIPLQQRKKCFRSLVELVEDLRLHATSGRSGVEAGLPLLLTRSSRLGPAGEAG